MIPVLSRPSAARRAVAAAPPAGYSDAFTGDDNTALATHDANWGNMNGTNTVARLKLLSNCCQLTGVWLQGGARYTASSAEVSQFVVKGNSTTCGFFPALRSDGSGSWYHVGVKASGGNWVGNTWARNGTFQATVSFSGGPFPVNADHTFRLWITGAATLHLSVDGVEQWSGTDGSPLAAGSPGFLIDGNGATPYVMIDDWTDQ